MESEAKESPKGFISAPSIDELRPTKEEQAKLEWLWAWEEQSRKSQFVWH